MNSFKKHNSNDFCLLSIHFFCAVYSVAVACLIAESCWPRPPRLSLCLSQETVDTGDDGEGGSCSSSGGGGRSENSRRRRRRRRQRLSRTVVNPDENFYFYWLMLLTVCVLYNVWTLIVRQSFPELQVRPCSVEAHTLLKTLQRISS